MKETNKLYKVTCKGMNYNDTGVIYGLGYVVATNPDEAYKKLRKFLDDNNLGYEKERELHTIELIASEERYNRIGFLLHL